MEPTHLPAALAPACDEARLIERLKAGEERAYEELVRGWAGHVRAVAVRVLRDAHEVDDVVQETFLSAFRALPRFEGRSQLGTWLHRIALNAALMRLRARAKRQEQEVDELLPEFVGKGCFREHQERWAELPEDPVEQEELAGVVRSRIADLPEKFRIPLLLRDIEGISNEELAERLGVTVNAAKIRVHRARQALRTLLEPFMRGQG